ncbi:Mrp/NBP35 family ATP-binding protein [Calycomorphotria hydatis]|nr:Mrp/NBP35 family ATP-binding protein [Calycomorphotria hydatis]
MSDLQASLASVPVPGFDKTLGELRLLTAVTDDKVTVTLPIPGYLQTDGLTNAIHAAAGKEVSVEYCVDIKGKNAGGKVGLKVKNIIAVGSGKGGVGKSTVSATLACGLQSMGAKVGLMDADVYGPSIPHMLGVPAAQPEMKEVTGPDGNVYQRMQPVVANGMPVMSMGFLIQPDQAVIWRGPMLHKALQQFLQQTDWGELDYLIIDLPPGTGDVSLTLSQLLGLSGAVIVCTPQQVALLDALKAASMYKQVEIPLLGIVENMTGDLFGQGGAKLMADEIGVPLLAEVPANATIREKGDFGKIAELFLADNPARQPLLNMCESIAIQCAKEVMKGGGGPSLQIL